MSNVSKTLSTRNIYIILYNTKKYKKLLHYQPRILFHNSHYSPY